ncbi:MAG: DMT family transporter [Campylobacter sp.]|nr:DMT family transporter [Campylobacter sp.]
MISKERIADISLIGVALVWGLTFLPMSKALQSNGVFTMLFWRFLLSAGFMGLMTLKFSKKFDPKSFKFGLILGVILFISFAFQTFALTMTYSSSVAFITGLECVIVPFYMAMIFKRKVSIFAIIGAMVAILGLWQLSDAKLGGELGEVLALLCAMTYALYTAFNGEFAKKCELYQLVFIVFLSIAILSFCFGLYFENSVLPVLNLDFYTAIVITVVFGTIFAYLVQTAMQRYTTATKTALFFSLEPVCAGFIGYFFGGEILTMLQIFGAALIIFGVLIAEVGENFVKNFKIYKNKI